MSFARSAPGVALFSLAFAACSVIVVASYAPRAAPLAAPAALAAVSGLLWATAVVRSARTGVARNVAAPTFAAAAIAVAFLELVFVYDGTRGGPLALLTIALVLVALDLPLLLGSSVAGYTTGRDGA